MLDERKIKILAAVVHDYIATAEPIGSRTIARKYRIGISPATIRNEMADLEEQGYLCQPHTSAGRVPSHKGYRYYVDFLMPARKLTDAEQALIRSIFDKRVTELEQLVKEAARVISNLTSYTALTMGPQLRTSRLKYIQVTRIDNNRGLLLMVTNYGTVSHNIIEMPQNINDSDLVRITNILNNNLTGKTISEITNDIMETIKNEMIEYDDILNVLFEILLENLEEEAESGNVVSTGSSKMLDYPEFQDVEKAKNFFALLEQRELMTKALKSSSKPNSINITIGIENPFTELQDFSIVTSNIIVDGKDLGVFGILGPTRMEYARVVSILEQATNYLVKTVSTML